MTTRTTPVRPWTERLRADTRHTLREIRRHRAHYAFMAPYAVLFIAFTLLPVIMAMYLSFTSFNLLEAPVWQGMRNYYRLFLNDDVFLIAFKNTVIMACIIGPVGYALSFLFAWLINELTHFMRVIFTIIFYAPSLAGGMLTIWALFFSGDSTAFVNGTLLRLNLITEPIIFFQNTGYMMPLVIIVSLWMSLGTTFLSFIAGFQGVDKQYYEAAAIDGLRNRWQELWFITLPLLRPNLLFGAVMSITAAFSVGSVSTALCGFPSTEYAVHTLMNHLEDHGTIRYEMGYDCAIATVLFLMMLLSNMAIQRLLRKVGE